MVNEKKIWKVDPHSLAKIEIVRNYLEAWFPIIGYTSKRMLYIDAFSGPGEYAGGEKGSPIVALETALNHHSRDVFKELVFIFIEADESRISNLEKIVKDYTIPDNIKVSFIHSSFEDAINDMLNNFSLRENNLPPAFLMIDPFGIKGVSLSNINRFLRNTRCEVLITFMAESVNRFMKLPEFDEHLAKLYGDRSWEELLDQKERFKLLVDLFEDKLKAIADFGWKFEMKDKMNKSKYFLFFATNNLKGLEKMKDAMWKIAPTGSYSFSDRFYMHRTLFELTSEDLKILLKDKLGGKRMNIEEIERFVLTETPFRKAHTKDALKLMERYGSIKVLSDRKRRLTYPERTRVQFI